MSDLNVPRETPSRPSGTPADKARRSEQKFVEANARALMDEAQSTVPGVPAVSAHVQLGMADRYQRIAVLIRRRDKLDLEIRELEKEMYNLRIKGVPNDS